MSERHCRLCGFAAPAVELRMYDHCERCESEAWERLKRWREGGVDVELDNAFGHKAVVH